MRLKACLLLLVITAAPAAAHHGIGSFDITKTVTLRGTVAKIEWTNPHVVLTLDVRKDNGSMEQWLIALSPPSVMMRKGLTRDAIKEGAAMSVTGYVATTAMAIRFTATEFTLPDGRTFITGNPNFRPLDSRSLKEFTIQKK